MNFEKFLEQKGMTMEQFKTKSAEDMANLYNEFNAEQRKAIDEMIANKASKEDVEKSIENLRDYQMKQMEQLNSAISEVGLAVKSMTEKAKENGQLNDLRSGLEAHKEDLSKLAVDKNAGFSFVVKTVGTMLESTNISGGNVPVEQRIPGLNVIATRVPRLLDLFARGRATSNKISWVYQANRDGSAGGTLEGNTKNQIDFDLVVGSEDVVKRTAFIKVSTEMLSDIDFIETEIRNELVRLLLKDAETTAYSGNGTAPALRGIRTVAPAFSAGTFANSVYNANELDVLVIAMNQIKIAEQGMPNYILMHPSDVTKLKLYKVSSSDRRYVDRLVNVGSTLVLDGVPIIETTLVTAGDYLIGDFTMATLYEKEGLNVTMGIDGNDFTKNLRTIIAEWRGALVVKNNNRTAFVKGTFATDKAAILLT